MPFEDGPYVQAACFCKTVLREQSGMYSLIQIIDTITQEARGPSPPEEMPSFPVTLQLVLLLKSGKARGRHELKVVPENPDGSTGNPFFHSVHFEGEERGQNLTVNLSYVFELEGLYWFFVYIGDEKLTAIPFRIRYKRMFTGATPD